jgi:formylglycine-generating enzyme required for sulfatase activity
MSYDIFLSYRRKDSSGHSNVGNSRTIKYAFERHGYEVFFDFNDCTDGYFAEKILPAIRTCRYFVLVLSKGCLERCRETGDWLRREIEEALKYGRTIIPVSPDGEFEGWPTDLPESIKALSANDGLQITTIHMDGIFEANMDQLIKERGMTPPQRRKDDGLENCAKLKVMSNLECVMYVDEEECANIVANKLKKIPLKPGEYMLKFESVENAADCVEEDEFIMPDKDKLYKVDLLSKKQERLERERREREEKERQKRERLERERRERREREAQGEFEVKGVKFKMVKVEGGTFMMGATEEQGTDAFDREKPVHQVTLSDYYIGETVVTQELWKAVMGNNPSKFTGDNERSVEMVSWEEAQEFIEKLNRETGREFRLPTEAEWEYAARGGNKSQGYKYSGSDNLDEVAWYRVNSGDKTHPVKEKKSNEIGLYDMSGNVWEWCQDWFGKYSRDAQLNPQGSSKGAYRVARGGSWFHDARFCRVSYRGDCAQMLHYFNLGFRLVMSL